MKLYELERDKNIKIKADVNGKDETITFHHIDNMYSYCTIDGFKEGEDIVHLFAATELKKEKDYYIIV